MLSLHSRLPLLSFFLTFCFTSTFARDVNFDDLFTNTNIVPQGSIPKIAHFVFTKTRPLAWLEYAAIKSSLVNLGVSKINIWVAPGALFEGNIWQLVLAFPEVHLREVEMPTTIYGNNVAVPAHVSDIVRLEAVYQEGGIYMDYNIVALKSSDPIIFNATTKSAVMAEQDSWSFGNAWFMARAASPFLKAWMQEYKGFNDSKWGDLSLGAPHRLYRAGGQDLTKLDYHTWYYPPCCADSSTQKLWFGQSFSDIDDSFGVHQWGGRWRSTAMLTPESVRTIDTPFFCRIRHLFNDIGDDYVAEDWRKNPNCSFTTLDTLPTNPDGLMGSYHFRHDTAIKILDDSGHRLHGWAPYRSGLPVSTDVDSFREFRKDEFAVLPVPIDYDARRGTIRTELLLQNGHTDEVDTAITLAMFRLDDDTKLYWSFVRHGSGNMTVQLEWGVYQQKVPDKSRSVFSTSSVFLDDNRYHVLQLAWDRVDTGLMTVHVDDSQEPLFQGNVTLLDEPVRGGELWINAFREAQTDTGFRGRIRSLRTYSTGYVHELVNGPTTSYSAGAGHTILPMLPESAHNMARTMGFQDMGAMAAWALWGLMSMSAVWVMTARKYGRIKRAWYNVLTPMSPPTSAELERDGTRYADALGSGVELRKTFVRSSSGWGNGSGR